MMLIHIPIPTLIRVDLDNSEFLKLIKIRFCIEYFYNIMPMPRPI